MTLDLPRPSGTSLAVDNTKGREPLSDFVRHLLLNPPLALFVCCCVALIAKAVQQIVDAVWAKLPPAVFVLPVARAEGEPLQLRVTAADLEEDNLLDVVSAGCCGPSAELLSSPLSLLLRLFTEVLASRMR